MNASELTDTELNRAMIWLYVSHVDQKLCDWFQCSLTEYFEEERISDDGQSFEICLSEWEYEVNFLTGYLAWDLSMPLAAENGLTIDFPRGDDDMMRVKHKIGHNWTVSNNSNPLRAICEVLVMIAMEKR